MRGDEESGEPLFSYVSVAQRVPKDHPLRQIRPLADTALSALSSEFDKVYSKVGRPSIPPEQLLRALLLQYLYGIRSERLLVEQLEYNLLFRWFVGLTMDSTVWDATVFSKNRERLLAGDIAQGFLNEVVGQAQRRGLTSDEHFSVDGTLIEAWASQKSFQPKGGSGGSGSGSGGGNFRGQQRRNDTHASTTDPDARLYRKGHSQEAKLSYMGHVVIENRNALVMACELSLATGYAERETAAQLLERIPRRRGATVGADKAYDTQDFVARVRGLGYTPHVAQNVTKRRSAIDGRTTSRPGYAASQVMRKLVEHPFGWIKSVAGLWQVKHRGRAKVGWNFALAIAAYNLTRIRTLTAA